MSTLAAAAIPAISALLGMPPVSGEWKGIDAVLPLLERMREDGCVVIVKLDGERIGPADTGPYTVVVSGRPLREDFLRIDHHHLEEALAIVIVGYARKQWGYVPAAGDA